MKKKILLTTTMIAVGTGTVLLRNEETRAKVGRKVREFYANLTNRTASDVAEDKRLKLGHPHPNEMEDNEMVNEGALYTVQYFNKEHQ
ncbi:hypothetical protein [Halalkalibacter urbisdiaboli]|uniref:hypothetical protein n=1 Tax=Halalkalibacter urbisdiaboli TaxID=1960589 RepID=UPI000B43D6EA|nr:hypothetical protein [Halalkalibacter urbisdiaboli]